ncbi:hypothetical protein [Halorussus salinisoli]|uniref:hypothetical protein n=1 Tax=Halorussus salinisoli TaxID=2558242 RepID=UPI0010C1974D|nr:hypothetical protein [Halorussus salinisoli]
MSIVYEIEIGEIGIYYVRVCYIGIYYIEVTVVSKARERAAPFSPTRLSVAPSAGLTPPQPRRSRMRPPSLARLARPLRAAPARAARGLPRR